MYSHISLLPSLSKKQKTIVSLIGTYRCLNRIQIQELLKHKGPRRVNSWLKDLVEKKYLGQKYSKKIGKNIKPAIYYLENNGIRWLRKQKNTLLPDAKKRYGDKKRSQLFYEHQAAIAEVLLVFHRTALVYQGKIRFYLPQSLKTILDVEETVPSLHMELQIPHKKRKRFLIQVFPGYLPQFIVKKQLLDCLSLLDATQSNTYPELGQVDSFIFVCTTYRQQIFLLKTIYEEKDSTYTQGTLFVTQARYLSQKTFDEIGWIKITLE